MPNEIRAKSMMKPKPTQPSHSRHSFSRNSLELNPSAAARFALAPKLVSTIRQKFEDLPSLRLKDDPATADAGFARQNSLTAARRRYAGNFEDATAATTAAAAAAVVGAKPKPMPRRLIGSKSDAHNSHQASKKPKTC